MNRLTQGLIQVTFLLVFLVLVALGRPQIWAGIFLLGVLLTFSSLSKFVKW